MDVLGENVICACRFQRMEKCEISMQITGRKGAACGVIVMYEVRSRCMETGFDGWEIEGFHSAKGERVKWNNAVGKLDVDYGRCLSSCIPPAFDKFSIHLSYVCSCSSFYLRHSVSMCSGKRNACLLPTFTISMHLYIIQKEFNVEYASYLRLFFNYVFKIIIRHTLEEI